MNRVQKFMASINEAMPDLVDLGTIGSIICIKLDNHRYCYSSNSDRSIEDIYKSFCGLLKYSKAKALSYLKKNTKLESGSIKGSPLIYTSDNPRYMSEAASKKVKSLKIVDGKKVLVTKEEYVIDCKEGYKRDPETGACVKMTLREQRDRSIAATKSANKYSTKRNKAISTRRRSALIRD